MTTEFNKLMNGRTQSKERLLRNSASEEFNPSLKEISRLNKDRKAPVRSTNAIAAQMWRFASGCPVKIIQGAKRQTRNPQAARVERRRRSD